MIRFRKLKQLDAQEKITIFGPTILVLIFGFALAYQFVSPAPPRSMTIGTGSVGGAYFDYAKTYQKLLAEYGIELTIKTTAGSADNIQLLETETGGVDIAFVQGGMKHLSTTGGLVSLGSLFFEPLWVFHQHRFELKRLTDLKGLRIAVGDDGSGTKVLATKVLNQNGISNENAQLVSVGAQHAVDLLLSGDLDVAMFVSTHRASYVSQLQDSKAVKLMGFERGKAYTLGYHYLYLLELPQGTLDLRANLPPHDLTLIAPTTQLLARSDLHPALIDLLLQAAKKIHYKGGGFEREGAFPSPKHIDFDLSEDAQRFYEAGPPFLQRYLPFWVATFLTRMKVMLLPLVVLLFPLFKIMPIAYRWRMRSKIYRWYSKLEAVDPKTHKKELPEHVDDYLLRLDMIEEQVSNVSVPLAYSEELYALRLHIGMLRQALLDLRTGEFQDEQG